MKTYALFDQTGAFSRLEQLDPGFLPPVPLADDGLPRAVKMQDEPTVAPGKKLLPTRTGGWAEVEADPSPVPSPLPAWRVRTVLRRRGLLGQVNALIAKLPEPQRILVEEQIESAQFERNHPIIEQFGAALGLTSEQLDDIFREADALV